MFALHLDLTLEGKKKNNKLHELLLADISQLSKYGQLVAHREEVCGKGEDRAETYCELLYTMQLS